MKIFFDMVGCRLNQAEIEQMALEFRKHGHSIVSNVDDADSVIVNTCSVTTQAASDSRQKIRRAGVNGKEVVVTGCWSTLEPEKALELPGVMQVVPNNQKDMLVHGYLSRMSGQSLPLFDTEPISRAPLPGLRQRTRAFIKVQDGCDNICTFCITTIARGKSISRSSRDILNDIHAAESGGTKEIVLTGVHLGSWGQEYNTPSHLTKLLEIILKETSIPRIRLSSLEPWDLDETFLSLWQDPRLCKHLHLPLQSGSDSVLKRMLRKTTTTSFRELVSNARKIIPGVAITTDLIVGFPGETEEEFEAGQQFVREMEFTGGHVFTYSEREGTAAVRIKGKVPHTLRKERNSILQDILRRSETKFLEANLGATATVLWEASNVRTAKGWKMCGLSSNYIKVTAEASEHLWNEMDQVLLEDVVGNGISGRILKEQPNENLPGS